MTTKCFVLDTNVLLHNPNSIKAFGNNKVILPIYTLEELDSFKKEQSELGRNARQVSRMLDKIRQQGSLTDGIPMERGSIQVRIASRSIPDEYVAIDNGADSKILAVALEANETEEGSVVLVTKDINLRIRGAALGLETVDYISEPDNTSEIHTGTIELKTDGSIIDTLFAEKETEMPDIRVHQNSFGVLSDGLQKSALVRFYPQEKIMRPIQGFNAWGISARNKEQQFALELLMDDSIKLITLTGQAGTGKTLISIAAGMEKVAEEKNFQKLLVSRPVFPLGKDIGYLPGDMNEKLRPWMQPIHDNLEYLMGISQEEKKKGRNTEELFDLGLIEVEPLTYIRGRSIPNQFIIVDEAQNLTPHEIKTIITRCGEGTKIILTGDVQQIDNPYIDSTNNGLTYVVNRFKGQKIYGHISLSKGERSELAETAAKLL